MFKVAHHGSSNAHDDRVWDGMLMAPPFALLTPFVRGSVRLPSADDCARTNSATPRAYICGPPTVRSAVRRSGVVEKMMAEVTKERHELDGACGQIRLRKANALQQSQSWSVDLFAGASSLAAVARAL